MGEVERWPRSVGGHVALDFVNTDVVSEGDRSTDVLRAADEFLAWCRFAGIESAAPAKLSGSAERVFREKAAALRGAVRSVVESLAEDRPADPHALATLREATADAFGRSIPRLTDGGLVWTWDATSPDTALHELAWAAVELLTDYPRGRLKVCPGCGFVFLDATKNGSRRWCSMDDCGKEEKMRRYVAKRSERRSRARSTDGGAA